MIMYALRRSVRLHIILVYNAYIDGLEAIILVYPANGYSTPLAALSINVPHPNFPKSLSEIDPWDFILVTDINFSRITNCMHRDYAASSL